MAVQEKVLLWTFALVLSVSACSQRDSKTDYTIGICMDPQNWGRLKETMLRFGARYNLGFYGEIEPLSKIGNPPLYDQLNYSLIGGLHQLGGDDFDLWLTSNPSSPKKVSLSVISKHDLTPQQSATVADFKEALAPLTCKPK